MRCCPLGRLASQCRPRRALCRRIGRRFERRDVIALASRERRLLLTEDKDFGDLFFRRGHPVPGIVLIRAGLDNSRFQIVRLAAAIEQYGERLIDHYVVIEEGRFRSRPLWSVK